MATPTAADTFAVAAPAPAAATPAPAQPDTSHHAASTSIDAALVGVVVDLKDACTSPTAPAGARTSVALGSGSAVGAAPPEDAWEVREGEVEVQDRIGGGSYGDIFKGNLWGTDVAVKLIVAAVVTEEVRACVLLPLMLLSTFAPCRAIEPTGPRELQV